MTMPGRAVRMVMRQRLAARSIRICGTEADSRRLLEQGADFAVFGEQLAELFLAGVPLRAPVVVDGDSQAEIGLRIAVNHDWRSKWYAGKKEFGKLLTEDREIAPSSRSALKSASARKS